jgi:GT2 family glycosyltransferase
MKNPLVSIVILSYAQQLIHTKRCLQSLKKLTYENIEIILVDNASIDNTVSYVKRYFPKVKVFESKKNLGFCGGNNQGFKIAKGKYIFFLNNDTEVKSDFVSILVNRLEDDPTIGAIQPKIRQLVLQNKLDACASYLTPTGFLYHFGYSQIHSLPNYNISLEMYSVKGAGFMVQKKLIDKIGLFDEDFFAYFEETDLCHRVWMSGYKVVYEPKAEIFHLGGGDKKNDHPESLQFISYRNRIQSYIKNLETSYLLKILPVHLLVCLGSAIVFLILNKPRVSYAIMLALFWNIKNVKIILKKRKKIQSTIRKVKEDSYFTKINKNAPISYYYHFLTNPRGKYSDIKV